MCEQCSALLADLYFTAHFMWRDTLRRKEGGEQDVFVMSQRHKFIILHLLIQELRDRNQCKYWFIYLCLNHYSWKVWCSHSFHLDLLFFHHLCFMKVTLIEAPVSAPQLYLVFTSWPWELLHFLFILYTVLRAFQCLIRVLVGLWATSGAGTARKRLSNYPGTSINVFHFHSRRFQRVDLFDSPSLWFWWLCFVNSCEKTN